MGKVHSWMQSFLSNRSQSVILSSSTIISSIPVTSDVLYSAIQLILGLQELSRSAKVRPSKLNHRSSSECCTIKGLPYRPLTLGLYHLPFPSSLLQLHLPSPIFTVYSFTVLSPLLPSVTI